MPITAISRDAPILDRLVEITLEYPGEYSDFGEFQPGRIATMKTWCCRLELDVDVASTGKGSIETGEAAYLIRWLPVSFTLGERDRSAKPAITVLEDEIGRRHVTGVVNWPGYRGRYLVLKCAGSSR